MELDLDFNPTLTITPVIDGKDYKVHVSELKEEEEIKSVLQTYDNMRREMLALEYERRKLASALAMTKQQLMGLTNKYVIEKYGLSQDDNVDTDNKEQPNE